MKTFLLIIFLSCCQFSFSQNHYRGIARNGPALVARKNGQMQRYRLGAAVRIVENSPSGKTICKGYITHFENNAFTLESFGHSQAPAKTISADQVEKIRYLSRRGRRSALILAGGAAVYSGIIAILTKPGPYQYILFLPSMACALYLIYYFPATYIVDLVFEKSIKRGWRFAVESNY